MALQKETISINIANSLDQKTDSKLIQPDKLAGVKNRRFAKIGALDKRPGQKELNRSVISSYPNPLTIGLSSGQTTVANFKDQLTLDNSGAFYSRLEEENAWQFKNHSSYVDIVTKAIASGKASNVSCDSATGIGYTVVVSAAKNENTSGFTFVFSCIDNETGSYTATNKVIISSGGSPFIKVFFINNSFVALYSTTGIYSTIIDPSNGSFTSPTLVEASSVVFDAILMNDTAAGNVIALATRSKLFLVSSLGAKITSPAETSFSLTAIDGVSIYSNPSISTNKLFLALQNSNQDVYSLGYTIGAGSISADYSTVVRSAPDAGFKNYNSFAQCLDPLTNNLIIFYDAISQGPRGPSGGAKVNASDFFPYRRIESFLDYSEITQSGSIISSGNYSRGLRLLAKPFSNEERKTILIPTVHDSDTASCAFLCDFNYGKERKGFVIAKWGYGKVGAPYPKGTFNTQFTGPISSTTVHSDLRVSFTGISREELLGIYPYPLFTPDFGQPTTNVDLPVYKSGISNFEVSFNPSARSVVEISNAQYSTGGFLQRYDETFSEDNFFLEPQKVWASMKASSPITLSYTDGGSGVRSRIKITAATGAVWKKAGLNAYIAFKQGGAGSPNDAYIYFIIDGQGSNPSPPGLLRVGSVSINTQTDSPEDIAKKIGEALQSFVDGTVNGIVDYESVNSPLDTIILEAGTAGSGATPTLSGLSISGAPIAAGSYQYVVIWRWADVEGRIHRSAPSVPITVTSGSAGFIGLNFICPPLTNRTTSSCGFEIYRTTNAGSTFYKVSDIKTFDPSDLDNETQSWQDGVARYSFLDDIPDSNLTRNPILYTQGGVLPNFQLGMCRQVSVHQGRVIVSTEDPTQLIFSKSLVDGAPIEFAIENEIRVQDNDSEITGHASMDDKLIIGKSESIYIVSGQFPNDLGTQGSLSRPQLIASDTGIESHNSIVLYPDGLIFKSKKGFYRLSRALQLDYIGQAVEDFNSFTVSKGVLDTLNNEIRFYHSDTAECLVYNYLLNKWSVFTNHVADSACVLDNVIYRAEASGKVHKSVEGTFKDVSLDGSGNAIVTFYSSEVELPWLKLKGVQDFQRIWFVSLLGEYKSPHLIEADYYYDYDMTSTDTYSISSEMIKSGVYQWKHKPRIQKCQAIKIKFREIPDSVAQDQTGESAKFMDVSFEVGLKQGLFKVSSGKRS